MLFEFNVIQCTLRFLCVTPFNDCLLLRYLMNIVKKNSRCKKERFDLVKVNLKMHDDEEQHDEYENEILFCTLNRTIELHKSFAAIG